MPTHHAASLKLPAPIASFFSSETTDPQAADAAGARTTVTAQVSGNFPGSPAQLRFAFTVAGHLITRLEIGS